MASRPLRTGSPLGNGQTGSSPNPASRQPHPPYANPQRAAPWDPPESCPRSKSVRSTQFSGTWNNIDASLKSRQNGKSERFFNANHRVTSPKWSYNLVLGNSEGGPNISPSYEMNSCRHSSVDAHASASSGTADKSGAVLSAPASPSVSAEKLVVMPRHRAPAAFAA